MEDFRQAISKHKNLYSDLRLFDRKSKIYGYLDRKACIVRINCTKMKYDHDCARFYADFLPVGYTTTFFHELTHYYQVTTTTNGMYISLLEDFQIILIDRLRSNLVNTNYPFIGNILSNNSTQNEKVDYCLYYWYAAELIKCLLECDFEKYNFLLEDTIFSDKDLSDIFCDVEREICKEFKIPYTGRNMNDNVFELPDDICEVIKRNSSPFENHARMAEFWWSTKYQENPFGPGCADLYEYSAWIQLFTQYAPSSSFDNIAASFMAICELAQFAPILPGLENVMEHSVFDYLPIYRMGKLVYFAKDVPPVTDLNDYNRYVNQLAQAAGYTLVEPLCQELLKNRWQKKGEYFWSDLFYNAIQIRSENFSTFYNYGFWHPLYQQIEPFTKHFLSIMLVPVVAFNDYVEIKHVDGTPIVFWDANTPKPKEAWDNSQETAMQIVVRDVFRQYFYTIMTGWGPIKNGVVYVECPIMADQNLMKMIEARTKQYIHKRFGFSPLLTLMGYKGLI